MNSLIPVLDAKHLTKTNISAAAHSMVSQMLDECDTAMEGYIRLRALSEAMKAAAADLELDAMLETREQRGHMCGVAFTVRPGRATYDYSEDRHWKELQNRLETAKERMTERQDIVLAADPLYNDLSGDVDMLEDALDHHEYKLRNMPWRDDIINASTGEILTPPNVNYGKASIALTFPKR